MLRNDATANSAFAALVATAANSVTFEWRGADGAQVQQEVASPAGGPVLTPVGLKLTRAGNTYTPYYSTDGINWIQLGPSQSRIHRHNRTCRACGHISQQQRADHRDFQQRRVLFSAAPGRWHLLDQRSALPQ